MASSILAMLPAWIYTAWATTSERSINDPLEWAVRYGAVGPISTLSLDDSWRFLAGPALHAHPYHLAGNTSLVMLGGLLLGWLAQTDQLSTHPLERDLSKCLWLSYPSILWLSAMLVVFVRSVIECDGWSIGVSGGALCIVSYVLTRASLGMRKWPRWLRVICFISPLVWVYSSHPQADDASHLIGAVIGALVAIYISLACRSEIASDA